MPIHDQEHPTFEPQYNLDGTVDLVVTAGGTLVKNTAYKVILNENGYVTAAMADPSSATKRFYVGVARAAASSGDVIRIQIGGRVTALITPSLSVAVGHSLEIHDGAIADVGADYSGTDADFCACITASTSSSTQDVMLIPRIILEST